MSAAGAAAGRPLPLGIDPKHRPVTSYARPAGPYWGNHDGRRATRSGQGAPRPIAQAADIVGVRISRRVPGRPGVSMAQRPRGDSRLAPPVLDRPLPRLKSPTHVPPKHPGGGAPGRRHLERPLGRRSTIRRPSGYKPDTEAGTHPGATRPCVRGSATGMLAAFAGRGRPRAAGLADGPVRPDATAWPPAMSLAGGPAPWTTP